MYRILRGPVGVLDVRAGIMAFCHPEDVERVRMELVRAERLHESYSIDHRIVRHDGTIGYVQHQGHWVFGGDGAVVSQFGTLLDITDRRMTE